MTTEASGPQDGAGAHSPESASDRFLAHRARGAVGTVLVVWILAMLFYLSYRHFERWDWTSEGRYTLSSESLRVLEELERPVEIYLFVAQGQADLRDFEELVANYQAASPKVTVRRVDPDRQRGEFALLVERFQLAQGQLNGSTVADVAAVVVSGDRHWKVDYDDLRSVDTSSFDDADGPKIDVRAEESFTGAIVEVTSGEATRVCLTSGHGELGLEGTERSIEGLRRRLSRMNVDLVPVEPRAQIPSECDAVFVLGPQSVFPARDVRAIREYLASGGDVLLALDPILDGEQLIRTGFEDLAREHGVEIGQDLVLELDPQRLLGGDPLNAFVALGHGRHELTEPLLDMPVVFLMNRSVKATPGSGAVELISASDVSYAERDLNGLRTLEPDGDDLRGPVPLAVAVTIDPETPAESEGAETNQGHLVVVGDSDFLTPELMSRPELANSTFASATTGWLTERRALITVPPRQANARPMNLTEGDLGGIAFRVLLLLPAAMAFLGLSVWWSRRP